MVETEAKSKVWQPTKTERSQLVYGDSTIAFMIGRDQVSNEVEASKVGVARVTQNAWEHGKGKGE